MKNEHEETKKHKEYKGYLGGIYLKTINRKRNQKNHRDSMIRRSYDLIISN